ncbi:L,D-transpeptidase [Lacunisphaera limnophila]|uniref:L,D-transpeptidase n=1 Tax=Lacunisphaera limnophila TaxID=1838286 RepID=UPI003CCD71D5
MPGEHRPQCRETPRRRAAHRRRRSRPELHLRPEVFPEVPEAQELGRRLIIPPGPNNPVGVAWIGLDRTGYGIHGTPEPEKVGRTESHGCFRVANWDARTLLRLAWTGLPVTVDP